MSFPMNGSSTMSASDVIDIFIRIGTVGRMTVDALFADVPIVNDGGLIEVG